MKKSEIIIAIFSFLVFLLPQNYVFAKEYYYENIEASITINKDSTFDVIEKQTYFLDGNFGYFNRDIAMKGIDAITDIEVFDGNDNKISQDDLYIRTISGVKRVEWNFARRDFLDENKSWTVKYKVHGGINFLKDYDEIYWNTIPSDRYVQIENVTVKVGLENREKFGTDLIRLYADNISDPIKEYSGYSEYIASDDYLLTVGRSVGGYYISQDNSQAIFWGKNIKPKTNFTIVAGFPKGIVDQSAYFKDFLSMYYGYILSVTIILLSLIVAYAYWYRTEKSREGQRAVIPEYEPPQNLKPAIAEIILKEKLTDRGLSATIIDLAMRGYVTIREMREDEMLFPKLYRRIRVMIIAVILIFIIVIILYPNVKTHDIIFVFTLNFLTLMLCTALIKKQYILTKAKEYKDDPDLDEYEKEYLNVLLGSSDCFSTGGMSEAEQKKMLKVKDKIYDKTDVSTKAFERSLNVEKTKNLILMALGYFVLVSAAIFGDFVVYIRQSAFPVFTFIVCSVGLYAFIKYEARLSGEGIKLKEGWLGFKTYLETAEKHRMQNLKPEYFEKYLPYAIIFGVEKKWAKAFEAMHMPAPKWYADPDYFSRVGTVFSKASISSFSPSVFSASFASSFTSAVSSSGAVRALDVMGRIGGGGGGGGGGAG